MTLPTSEGPTRRQLLQGAAIVGAASLGLSTGCRLISAGPKRFDDLTVGAIGIFPNPGEKFEGELPETALKAALGKLNSQGGALGRNVVFRGAQAGTEDEAFDGYRRLEADPSVVGIILATPLASEQIVDAAGSAGMPLIVTSFDLEGRGQLWPAAETARSVFQFHVPEAWSLEAAAQYCATDRKYRSAAMIYDDFLFTHAGKAFSSACSANGLQVSAVEQFGSGDSTLPEQLSRLARSGSSALFVWADPQTTADVARSMKSLGFEYIDSLRARSPGSGQWHPQLVGCPTGMFERDWATAAEDAAVPGSVTPGDIGSFRKGPRWLPEEWGNDFGLDWDKKKESRRGLRPIVDSACALIESVRRVNSAARSEVVRGLESGRDFVFASTPFGFTGDNHVAITQSDLAMFTLERAGPVATDPAYELGTEWGLKIMADPDMTLLVRPRLQSLQSTHPSLMGSLVEGGYGTQCSKSAAGNLTAACKIH
ncbi:MAG: hypothetical protein DCC49_01020 [Acidobacteria bacterium]|nr:MAG: hypothetical protein DCC49_01020 [Acidobacteriota bacterium]